MAAAQPASAQVVSRYVHRAGVIPFRSCLTRRRPPLARIARPTLRLMVTLGVLAGFAASGFRNRADALGGIERGGGGTTFTCQVVSVHDGDTLTCAGGTRVRLHAVAARVLAESCRRGHACPAASGASARRALVGMAGGQRLTCEATGTSYDRVVGLCRTHDGIEITCAMVRGGYAVVWARFARERPICT